MKTAGPLRAPIEAIRGTAVLASFFGATPLLALRILRLAPNARGPARDVLRSHAARIRERARISVDVVGQEHVPQGAYVLVYNQTSVLDDIGNIDVVWGLVDRSVLAAEYARLPFFTSIAERLGITLMKRGDRAATERALTELATAASRGERVGMAAEGRLSPDGSVGHFKRGAFLVAIRAGCPVLPMAVQGGRELLRPASLRFRPGTLRYRIGAPLATRGLAEEDAPTLAERARAEVSRLYAGAASEAVEIQGR